MRHDSLKDRGQRPRPTAGGRPRGPGRRGGRGLLRRGRACSGDRWRHRCHGEGPLWGAVLRVVDAGAGSRHRGRGGRCRGGGPGYRVDTAFADRSQWTVRSHQRCRRCGCCRPRQWMPAARARFSRAGSHQVPDLVQVRFLVHGAQGDPAQPCAGAEGSWLVAEQDGDRQVHGREVGEAGDGHVGEFLRGTGDVEHGAGADSGVVRQLQPPTREHGQPAGPGLADEEQPCRRGSPGGWVWWWLRRIGSGACGGGRRQRGSARRGGRDAAGAVEPCVGGLGSDLRLMRGRGFGWVQGAESLFGGGVVVLAVAGVRAVHTGESFGVGTVLGFPSFLTCPASVDAVPRRTDATRKDDVPFVPAPARRAAPLAAHPVPGPRSPHPDTQPGPSRGPHPGPASRRTHGCRTHGCRAHGF